MPLIHKKQKAQVLRFQGKTYNEIAKQAGGSKSTLSGWFRVSKIPKNQRPQNRLPYGVCRFIIHGVQIVDKMKGWIEGLRYTRKTFQREQSRA